jgi:hypothetical protein
MRVNFAGAVLMGLVVSCCADMTSHRAAGQTAPITSTPTSIKSPANGPLWISDGGGFVPSAGIVNPDVPCQLVSLSLQPHASDTLSSKAVLVGKPSPCQKASLYIGYLRSTLFIEGLDRDGRRLFVATGPNPQHQDVEAPSSSTGQMSWHSVDTAPSTISTFIQAPITPALSRIRWYDVDENAQPRLIGEMPWGNVQPATQ